MKKIKKAVVMSLTAAFIFGAAAGVSAHEHKIITPNGNEVIIKEEPFHGTDPTNGKILNNKHYDDQRGLHPIHYMLHTGPGSDKRAIEVVVN